MRNYLIFLLPSLPRGLNWLGVLTIIAFIQQQLSGKSDESALVHSYLW